MEDYARYLRNKAFSENTICSYTCAVNQMLSRFGHEITDEKLLSHKDWLAAEHSVKTVNTRITAINSYLDFIVYDGIRLKGLRVQQKPFLDNVISQEEYELMRDSLLADGEMFWHFVVRFLTCTGARISELRMFTCGDVRTGHLDIVSKGQKLRRINVPALLQKDALQWIDKSASDEDYVFARSGGKPMTSRGISMGLKRFAVKYGINPDVVYPHSFRHRFAKNFIARDPDIAFLADLMGHENIETTRIYLRRTAVEQRDAVDATIDW